MKYVIKSVFVKIAMFHNVLNTLIVSTNTHCTLVWSSQVVVFTITFSLVLLSSLCKQHQSLDMTGTK